MPTKQDLLEFFQQLLSEIRNSKPVTLPGVVTKVQDPALCLALSIWWSEKQKKLSADYENTIRKKKIFEISSTTNTPRKIYRYHHRAGRNNEQKSSLHLHCMEQYQCNSTDVYNPPSSLYKSTPDQYRTNDLATVILALCNA